jgi:dihydroxy-acid dehydratase
VSQRGITGAGSALFRDDGQDGLIHRAFLRGSGHTAEEVRRYPVIGIANSASDLSPCNAGLTRLVDDVKRGVRQAGGLPLEFPTISISEPFTRPTSLYLRNLMSMDVEEMISTAPIDGVVLLGGCDKTVPAQIMGAVSANKPAVMLVAGPRPVSCHRDNREFTVDDGWPLCDARRAGIVDDDEWRELEADLNTAVGTCNVLGTASSMAAVAEVLGFALPGSSFQDATSAHRAAIARATGEAAVTAVREGRTPRERITLAALENAFRTVTALGGSTNTVIHLEAIAGRAGHRIGIDRFDQWSRTTPYLANVRPGGARTLPALAAIGGVPRVMHEIRDDLHLEERTALGATWGEALAAVAATDPGDVLFTRPAPGALRVLRGNLAPSGALVKLAGVRSDRLLQHRGRVIVFDGIEDLNARIDDPDLDVDASSILVLRGLGPVGAPGMPEVGHLPIPAKLHRVGVTDMVRISDARMSGTSTGMVVLHVAPEAAVGGPLAYLRDGDEVEIDVAAGTLRHLVDEDELMARTPRTTRPGPARGFGRLHADHVLQADQGCDFDFLQDPQAAQPTTAAS